VTLNSLEQAVYEYLTGHAGFAGAVDDRLYPVVLPQQAVMPAVVYQRISGTRDLRQDGASDLARARVQFGCTGNDYLELKNGAVKQLRLALHGLKQVDGGAALVAAEIVNEVDLYDDETKLHRILVDAMIWYREAQA
jgi:hypothetical protein